MKEAKKILCLSPQPASLPPHHPWADSSHSSRVREPSESRCSRTTLQQAEVHFGSAPSDLGM